MPIFTTYIAPPAENQNGFLRASKTVNQTVARFVWTPLVWEQGTSPANGVMTVNPGTSQITINEAGAIFVNCVVLWQNFTAGGYRNFRLWNIDTGAAGAGFTMVTGSGTHYLSYTLTYNFGDVTNFRFEVYQDSDAVAPTILAIDAAYGRSRLGILWSK